MTPTNVATIRSQIAKLAEMSAQFFKHAARIKLTSWRSFDATCASALQMQRQALVTLYPKDHLKVSDYLRRGSCVEVVEWLLYIDWVLYISASIDF